MVSLSVALPLGRVPSLQQLIQRLQEPAGHFLDLLVRRRLPKQRGMSFYLLIILFVTHGRTGRYGILMSSSSFTRISIGDKPDSDIIKTTPSKNLLPSAEEMVFLKKRVRSKPERLCKQAALLFKNDVCQEASPSHETLLSCYRAIIKNR